MHLQHEILADRLALVETFTVTPGQPRMMRYGCTLYTPHRPIGTLHVGGKGQSSLTLNKVEGLDDLPYKAR